MHENGYKLTLLIISSQLTLKFISSLGFDLPETELNPWFDLNYFSFNIQMKFDAIFLSHF